MIEKTGGKLRGLESFIEIGTVDESQAKDYSSADLYIKGVRHTISVNSHGGVEMDGKVITLNDLPAKADRMVVH